MVFYFTASTGHVMYMGKDKFENEDLIKYCWAEDIWFHVDDLSSAHVYLRYPAPGTKHKPADINEIPPELVAECSQLVKANSIEGCKKASVRIVYTPGSNLRKTADMKTGQVGFKDKKLVIRTTIEKEKTIVKAIEKTREEMCVLEEFPLCSHPLIDGVSLLQAAAACVAHHQQLCLHSAAWMPAGFGC